MEYQTVTNLLDNTPNQPSKFMTKNWAETNYESYGTYNTGSQIKFKTLMLRSSLCENCDTYILAQGTMAVKNIGTAAASGGCNPVNWLSQTRGNLTIEYLNLNFVTTPKLTPLNSFYAEKVFISCVWLIPVSRVRTRPSLFDTDILQHILLDLKFSTRSTPVDISN